MTKPTPLFRRSRTGSARVVGLVVAGAVALVFAGALVYVATSRPAGPAPDAPLPPEAPPNITSRGADGNLVTGMAGSSDVLIQVVDRQRPSRLEAEIRAARSEPLAGNAYSLTQPSASIFLRDGRTITVDAQRGQATIPAAGGRPQNGTLEGDVVLRLFAPTPGRVPSRTTDRPLATLRTGTLRFDAALGRLEMPGAVTGDGEAFDFAGRGMLVLYSEATKHVDLLHLDALTKPLTIRPTAMPSRPAPPAAVAAGSSEASAPAGATPANSAIQATPPSDVPKVAPVESLYAANFSGPFTASQTGRTLSSEGALVMLRLFDNQLRPGAIGRPASGPAKAGPGVGATPPADANGSSAAVGASSPPASSASEPAPPAGDDAIVLHWAGPLDVRPLATPPQELAHDDVFARFTSVAPGGVRLTDTASSALAEGNLFEYGATTRSIVLAQSGAESAMVTAPERGEARAGRFELSLATGHVRIPTAGTLTQLSAPDSGGEPATKFVSWRNEADFDLALSGGTGGTLSGRPTSARVAGDVVAQDGSSWLAASALSASFFADLPSSPVSHVQLVGNARARDASSGQLDAQTLDVHFEPIANASRIARVVGRGDVFAAREGQWLAADELTAQVERVATHPGEAPRDQPVRIEAKGGIRFAGRDGVGACADELLALPLSETVALSGPQATVCREQSEITSTFLHLSGRSRVLRSSGPGTLHHVDPESARRVSVQWASALEFGDADGLGYCDGAVAAAITAADSGVDLISAPSIDLEADPADAPRPAGTSRSLRTAVARGDASQLVTVESRRYAPAASGSSPPRLATLHYLEAPTINVDAAGGRVDVPAAGKLLLVDRRDSPAPTARGVLDSSTSARGRTLITWDGRMDFDRAHGVVRASDNVRLVHDEGGLGSVATQLQCATLSARIQELGASDGGEPRGQLRSVSAAGDVWMKSATRELTAAELAFDADTGVVEAGAARADAVTIIDLSSGVPARAGHVRWNTRTDRVELLNVQPVVAPR